MTASPNGRRLLKSLELQGYKTFASRTLFEFGETVTAIVGPNGSGKSNIADAIRWVLGEQTYSLLRGKKTEDMIFSGSEQRARASMAQATITFDNSTGWLPIDFSEVTISRRAYRDGQNEYLLNGRRVRLREVSELLAQVGLAERTYTIIGQGLVDAALSLKAEERRRLFEEAAGIGLYRARREESLRRLESTRHNLERVQDILAELRPRLRSLERQAQRAREYDQVKADLEAVLRLWHGHHWHRMVQQVGEAQQAADRARAGRDQLRQTLAVAEEQLAATRARIDRLRSEMHAASQQVSGLYGQRQVLGTRLAVAQERLRWLEEQAAQLESEGASLEQARSVPAQRLEAARTEVEARALALAEAERALQQDAGGDSPMGRFEAAGRALQELAARQAAWEAQAAQIDAALREAGGRREHWQGALEAARGSLAPLEAAAAEAAEGLEQASTRRQGARAVEAQAQQKLESAEADAIRAAAEASERRAQAAALEARADVLARQEQEVEQAHDQLQRAAAAGQLTGAVGRLSQHLSVRPEHEAAVAAALGDLADGLAVQQLDDVLAALDWLAQREDAPPAALAALAPGRQAPQPLRLEIEGWVGNAAELAQADSTARELVLRLLGRTVVVRDRAAARAALSSLPEGARAVTLAGEVFDPAGWALAGRPGRRGAARRAQRGRLEGQLDQARRAAANAEAAQAETAGALQAAREAAARRRAEHHAALEDEGAARQAAEAARAGLEEARRTAAFAAERLREVEAEVARLEGERTGRAGMEEGLAGERARLEVELRLAGEAVRAAQAGDVAARAAEARARYEAARRSHEEAQARARELGEHLQGLTREREARARRVEANRAESEALRQQAAQAEEQMRELEARLEAVQTRSQPMEQALAEAEAQRAELEAAEGQARTQLQGAERSHSQAQIDLARRQEEMNSLKHRIEDDFGLVAFEVDDLAAPLQTPLPFEGLVEKLTVVEELPAEVEGQVNRLRNQLRRMGAINPEAQREHREVKERVEFLTTQVDDLRRAEAQLHDVIAELDELMRREFRLTFEAVAAAFGESFTRLFGGGSARLRLTDPDDLSLTGIDIDARLPGRREQGLAMLSGGERSLTACALIFALLKVSPTPVCVLDEVDAMLDEANVARFRDILRELSRSTQFIIITHNRETVQAAEVVYGVTMGRDSVSAVISLRLDEATRKVEKRPTA